MAINPTEIQLSEAQREYVAEYAERAGVPWPEVLQVMVPTKTIPTNTTPAEVPLSACDLARQLGFIGMSDDGPADFATNPIHLEGFGSNGEGFGNDGFGSNQAETSAR